MSFLRKNIKKAKKDKGQVLGTAVVMGAVVLIFALAMVYMLRTTIGLSVNVNAGNNAVLGADAIIAKSINTLEQGNNWGSSLGYTFTPVPGYKGDKVYMDLPNTMYIVQINPGNLTTSPGDQAKPTNLTSPPGDKAYERTITVDIYSLPPNYPTPSAAPTPWTMAGGSKPVSYLNHRVIQEVVRRGATGDAISADGTINVGGHWQIYWGDVYDFDQIPVTSSGTSVVLSLGNSQGLGPGYPSFHTQMGCIQSSGSCAGCFGGSGGFSGSTYCQITDSGAPNCQMYPNDPNMPPEPSVDLTGMRTKAMTIYYPASGQPGYPCSSGESGYFYNKQATPGPSNLGNNSVGPVTCNNSTAGAANETNHQYAGSGDFSCRSGQADAVLGRMQQNLGQTSSWVGNDDLVFYVDTLDYGVSMTAANDIGTVNFKQFAFRGTFILNGDYNNNGNGGSGAPTIPMAPPNASWCPAAFSGAPEMNGFLYVAGSFSSTGNPFFYGSVDVIGNVSGTGTPKIYYRGDFNYNLIQNGTVASERWQEVKSFPTPLP